MDLPWLMMAAGGVMHRSCHISLSPKGISHGKVSTPAFLNYLSLKDSDV